MDMVAVLSGDSGIGYRMSKVPSGRGKSSTFGRSGTREESGGWWMRMGPTTRPVDRRTVKAMSSSRVREGKVSVVESGEETTPVTVEV